MPINVKLNFLIWDDESQTEVPMHSKSFSVDINKDFSHCLTNNLMSADKKVKFNSFSSSDNVKDQKYLTRLLGDGGFLL